MIVCNIKAYGVIVKALKSYKRRFCIFVDLKDVIVSVCNSSGNRNYGFNGILVALRSRIAGIIGGVINSGGLRLIIGGIVGLVSIRVIILYNRPSYTTVKRDLISFIFRVVS